jgi:hypothetical protein
VLANVFIVSVSDRFRLTQHGLNYKSEQQRRNKAIRIVHSSRMGQEQIVANPGQEQIVANPKDTHRSISASTMSSIVWIFFLLACILPGVIHATDPASSSSSPSPLAITKTSALGPVDQSANRNNNLHYNIQVSSPSKAPTMKKITVTRNGEKTRTFELSNQNDYVRILSSLNAFSLKDGNDVEMVGFQSLENGQSYNILDKMDPLSSSSSSSPTTKTSSLPQLEGSTNSNNLHILPVHISNVSKAPNTTKKITVTRPWEKKRTFDLSNQDDYLRILSSLNAFSLKDYNGVEMVGFESLENTRSYKLGKIMKQEYDTDRFRGVMLGSIVGTIVGVLIYLLLL